MRFNIGDSVLCTTDDDNEKYRLTPGKYYTILQNSNSHVVVNNDYDKLKIILGID